MNLEYQPNKFDIVNKDEQKVIVGKLQMLETIVELFNTMRESFTRQLVVNGNACEEDVFEDKIVKEL